MCGWGNRCGRAANYSAYGTAVDAAAGLEKLSHHYGLGVIVGENTVNHTISDFAFVEIDRSGGDKGGGSMHLYTVIGDAHILNKKSFRQFQGRA